MGAHLSVCRPALVDNSGWKGENSRDNDVGPACLADPNIEAATG